MKKFFTILLALVLAFSLVACNGSETSGSGSGGSGTTSGSGSTDGSDASGDKTLVTVTVPKTISTKWFETMKIETDAWAEEYNSKGYSVTNHFIGPTNVDAALQLQSLSDAIALNPDILCVVPIASDSVDEQLAIARSNGTTVISHEGSTLKNVDYNVDAFSNEAYGANFAELIHQYGGDSGKVAITVGTLTETSHVEWAEACYNTLQEKYPGWESVTGTDWIETKTADNAYEVGKQILQANPDLNCFVVSAAQAANGLARAVEELGKTGEVMIIGNASASDRIDCWEAGTLTHTTFWYPGNCAKAAYEVGRRVREGETLKTGDDLGIPGFESITVEGNQIRGSGWYDVTPDNYLEMAEIL